MITSLAQRTEQTKITEDIGPQIESQNSSSSHEEMPAPTEKIPAQQTMTLLLRQESGQISINLPSEMGQIFSCMKAPAE